MYVEIEFVFHCGMGGRFCIHVYISGKEEEEEDMSMK